MRAILIGALAIFFGMIAIAHHWNLGGGKLFADCRVVPTPEGRNGQWWACTAGKLSGQTDLGRSGCDQELRVGPIQYWSCPAPFKGTPST